MGVLGGIGKAAFALLIDELDQVIKGDVGLISSPIIGGEAVDRKPFFHKNGNMKTTIDLPDQLMIEVKIMAAREQRKLGELMAELVHAGIESRARPVAPSGQPASAEQWLAAWLKLADELMQDMPDGPAARELLDEERNRLERR